MTRMRFSARGAYNDFNSSMPAQEARRKRDAEYVARFAAEIDEQQAAQKQARADALNRRPAK